MTERDRLINLFAILEVAQAHIADAKNAIEKRAPAGVKQYLLEAQINLDLAKAAIEAQIESIDLAATLGESDD